MKKLTSGLIELTTLIMLEIAAMRFGFVPLFVFEDRDDSPPVTELCDVPSISFQDVRLLFASSVQLVNILLQIWTSCLRVIDWSCETRLRSALIAFRLYRCDSQRDVRHACRQSGFQTPGRLFLLAVSSHGTALSTKRRSFAPGSTLLVFMYSSMRWLSLMVRSEFDFD